MDKFNKIVKNVLIFLVIFLAINYLMQYFFPKTPTTPPEQTNPAVELSTTKISYPRNKIVTIQLQNNTDQSVLIPNECPNEPFKVFKKVGAEWQQITATPNLNCANATEIMVQPGKKQLIAYNNWNHALFGNMGTFKIEFITQVLGKDQTLTTNEFTITQEGLFSQLWEAVFYRPIYNILIFLAYILPFNDLGFAIILLTILIRTILLIPSQKAMKSQRRMQELQPRLDTIKEKHKGDQQKIASETMALWKDAKVNPFGSCLPLLLQFPFLIAVFYVIRDGLNPDYSYMLYTVYNNFSLSQINTNFLHILDLTQVNRYVLPVIIGGLQFAQMKLAMVKKAKKDKDTKALAEKKEHKNEMAMATTSMTYIMPVMIAVFTASVPAGVGLYWGVSTAYGIVQQLFVNKDPSDKKKTEEDVKVRVIEAK